MSKESIDIILNRLDKLEDRTTNARTTVSIKRLLDKGVITIEEAQILSAECKELSYERSGRDYR